VRRDVLGEGFRVDLVEGVVRGVVQVEVVRAVLAQARPGHAVRGDDADVRAGTTVAGHVLDAQRGQCLGDACVGLRRLRCTRAGIRVDAPRAEVALGRDLVQRDLVRMRDRIAATAGQAVFLVGEGHDPDAARGRARQVADQLAGRHRDADAGRVVDRAGTQVPGIQVPADQHDFVRTLAAGDLADHVVRGRHAVPPAVQREAYVDRLAQRQQPGQLFRVGYRQCRGRDRLQAFLEAGAARVRVAVRVGAGRAHQV